MDPTPYMLRKFGPKKKGDSSIGTLCPGCSLPFEAGCYTTLLVVGPGDDLESQRRCREGEPYNAVAIEAHWSCVTGEPDAET